MSLGIDRASSVWGFIASRRAPSLLAIAGTLTSLWLAGCQAPASDADASAKVQPQRNPSVSGDTVSVPVIRVDMSRRIEADPPAGIEAEAVRPLTGDALDRALTPLPEIRETLPLPEGLVSSRDEPLDGNAEQAPALAAEDQLESPSLQAQRLFAAALQQGLEGQGSQSVRLLEAAIKQNPDHPILLRRLALGWAGLGNRVRAAGYFRQAVASNPDDLESVVALGRLLAESGEVETGTAALLYALSHEAELETIDAALPALARFYASAGLRRAGYVEASADLLDGFLDAEPPRALRPTRYGAELIFLLRRGPVHEVARGDLQAQLGDFRAARLAYERARVLGASGDDLTRRIVFADLWLGRLEEATAEVVSTLGGSPGSPAALGMVEYLIRQGLPAGPVIDQLRALPADADDPDAATLALASALPRDAAIELLGETLDQRPAAERVYEKQIGLLLDGSASADDRLRAVRRAAAAIEADSNRAAVAAGAVLAVAADLLAVRNAFNGLAQAERDTPAAATLEAIVLMELGETEAAEVKLDTALASPNPPTLARIEKARLLALSGDFLAAQAILDTVDADAADARLGQLRVAVLLELDRTDEALALLGELIAKRPTDARLAIQKAGVLVRQERFADAEQALLDVINANPRAESAYAALLRIYDAHGGSLPDYPQGYQRLLRRMFATIPKSRIARLTNAGILEVRGNHAQAERELDKLLEDNPNDRDALIVLIDVYTKTDRVAEADAIVERLLEADPQNGEVLRAAVDHYRRTRNEAALAQVEERWLLAQEPSIGRDVALARLFARQHRFDEAFVLMNQTIANAEEQQGLFVRFVVAREAAREADLEEHEAVLLRVVNDPDMDAGLRKTVAYALSNLYEAVGRAKDTDALYGRLLDALPDDPELKNHVGYVWAFAGRHLERAEALIADALEAEPEQAAYLDSMGWVRYKRGDLAGAERWLRRSLAAPGGDNPVILDHLGDVLFRLGRPDEARAMWERAREAMEDPANQETGDPETDTVTERATAKLEALAAEVEVDVPVSALGPDVIVDLPAPANSDAAQPVESSP